VRDRPESAVLVYRMTNSAPGESRIRLQAAAKWPKASVDILDLP